MISQNDIAGLILAGGRGQRFGNLDKGWLRYNNRPLIRYAMDAISECDTHLISANRSIHDYQELDALVVKDRRADFIGPLSGIESAMNASSAEWFYVVSVDVVGLSADWLDHLIEKQHQTKALWVGTHIHDRLQPLVGLWSRQLLPMISEYLDQGERRVMEFVAPWQDSYATIPSDQMVINVNTPEVLEQLSSS